MFIYNFRIYILENGKRERPISSLIEPPNPKTPYLDDTDTDDDNEENNAKDDDRDYTCEDDEVEKEKELNSLSSKTPSKSRKKTSPEVSNSETTDKRSPVFIAIKKRGSTVSIVKNMIPKMLDVLKEEMSVDELIELSAKGEFPDKHFLIGIINIYNNYNFKKII